MAYYSTILREEEQKFGSDGSRIGKGEIGDLAHQKVYFGVNWRVNTNLNALLRGRFIGDRTPIDTNPFDVIGGYFTMDLNLRYENLFAPGVTVGLKVVNLLDRKYYHPGIREANSGDPDTFAAQLSAERDAGGRAVPGEDLQLPPANVIYCFGDHNDKYTCNRQL